MRSHPKSRSILSDQTAIETYKKGEIDHVARLAESQREWLKSAKRVSSDSDDSLLNNRIKRQTRVPADRCPLDRPRKLGVALRRFPKAVQKSSSSSFDISDESILVIDQRRMRGVKSGSVDRNELIRNDKAHQKIDCIDNPVLSRTSKLSKPSTEGDNLNDCIRGRHLISIGKSSFNRCNVTAALGDSIQFVLVEVEEALLIGEHVLTGSRTVRAYIDNTSLWPCLSLRT